MASLTTRNHEDGYDEEPHANKKYQNENCKKDVDRAKATKNYILISYNLLYNLYAAKKAAENDAQEAEKIQEAFTKSHQELLRSYNDSVKELDTLVKNSQTALRQVRLIDKEIRNLKRNRCAAYHHAPEIMAKGNSALRYLKHKCPTLVANYTNIPFRVPDLPTHDDDKREEELRSITAITSPPSAKHNDDQVSTTALASPTPSQARSTTQTEDSHSTNSSKSSNDFRLPPELLVQYDTDNNDDGAYEEDEEDEEVDRKMPASSTTNPELKRKTQSLITDFKRVRRSPQKLGNLQGFATPPPKAQLFPEEVESMQSPSQSTAQNPSTERRSPWDNPQLNVMMHSVNKNAKTTMKCKEEETHEEKDKQP